MGTVEACGSWDGLLAMQLGGAHAGSWTCTACEA